MRITQPVTLPSTAVMIFLWTAGTAQQAVQGPGLQPLEGTQPLDWAGDIASRLVDGVERFILSLKQEFLRRIHVPSSESRMLGAMAAYQRWYNEHRPHASLDGRTPREMLAGALPPHAWPRIEPRARYPIGGGPPARRARGPLVLIVDHVGGFRELPVVRLREAA